MTRRSVVVYIDEKAHADLLAEANRNGLALAAWMRKVLYAQVGFAESVTTKALPQKPDRAQKKRELKDELARAWANTPGARPA